MIWNRLPTEPQGFGDPDRIIEILLRVDGWSSVEVAAELADDVARRIREALGCQTRLQRALYHKLDGDPAGGEHRDVRLLNAGDEPVLSRSATDLRLTDPRDQLALITAGAILDGRVVAAAHSAAWSARHADIGVWTVEAFRGRGLATAAARLVAREVQRQQRVPVWTTGEDNVASLRIAEKLGFVRCGERVYVIPDSEGA